MREMISPVFFMLSEWHGDIEFRPRQVVYCGVRVTVTILGGLGTSNARFVAPFPIELKIRYKYSPHRRASFFAPEKYLHFFTREDIRVNWFGA